VIQAEKQSYVAKVAEVAASQPQNQKSAEVIILDAVRAGKRSHGTVARTSMLGVTRTYQEIDKLRDNGKIHQASDGKLSVAEDDRNEK
jgi:hypothetical protein